MPLLATLLLVASLGAYLIPIQLLRKASRQAQDYFIAAERTPPGVIQNSSIAYALKMATLGPFFAWGASGNFWPAIIASAALGLGLYLLTALRRPMLAFFEGALARDQSITVHEFIARRHGSDSSRAPFCSRPDGFRSFRSCRLRSVWRCDPAQAGHAGNPA